MPLLLQRREAEHDVVGGDRRAVGEARLAAAARTSPTCGRRRCRPLLAIRPYIASGSSAARTIRLSNTSSTPLRRVALEDERIEAVERQPPAAADVAEPAALGRVRIDVVEMREARRVLELAERRDAVARLGRRPAWRQRATTARRDHRSITMLSMSTRRVAPAPCLRRCAATVPASPPDALARACVEPPHAVERRAQRRQLVRPAELVPVGDAVERDSATAPRCSGSTAARGRAPRVAATSSARSLAKITFSISLSIALFLMPDRRCMLPSWSATRSTSRARCSLPGDDRLADDVATIMSKSNERMRRSILRRVDRRASLRLDAELLEIVDVAQHVALECRRVEQDLDLQRLAGRRCAIALPLSVQPASCSSLRGLREIAPVLAVAAADRLLEFGGEHARRHALRRCLLHFLQQLQLAALRQPGRLQLGVVEEARRARCTANRAAARSSPRN